jgi:hypothetical protein
VGAGCCRRAVVRLAAKRRADRATLRAARWSSCGRVSPSDLSSIPWELEAGWDWARIESASDAWRMKMSSLGRATLQICHATPTSCHFLSRANMAPAKSPNTTREGRLSCLPAPKRCGDAEKSTAPKAATPRLRGRDHLTPTDSLEPCGVGESTVHFCLNLGRGFWQASPDVASRPQSRGKRAINEVGTLILVEEALVNPLGLDRATSRAGGWPL